MLGFRVLGDQQLNERRRASLEESVPYTVQSPGQIRDTCVCSRTWKYVRKYNTFGVNNTSKHNPRTRHRRRLAEPETVSSRGRTAKERRNVLRKAAVSQDMMGAMSSTSNLFMV